MTIAVASEVSSGDATDAQTSVSAPSISLTAGDFIHVVVTHGMSDTVNMAATPLTNTGTAISFSAALDNVDDTNNHQRLVHYYAAITTTQSTVITASFNSAATYRHIKVKRITGASGYDTHAAQRQDTPGTSTDGVSSGNTAALAAQPALISSVTTATGAARTTAVGTGFNNDQSSAWQFGTGTNMSASESKRLTSTSATAATYTAASNDAQLTVAAVFTEAATGTQDQEGFRWGKDDDTESAHTWEAAQDTDITIASGQSRLLRTLIDATDDPSSTAYVLRYQKNGSGGYVPVPVGSTRTVSVDVTIAQSGDDAQQSGTTMTVNGTTVGASLDATTEYVGLRFPNVTVPQGATVTAAYISVVPSGTGEDEPLVTIDLQDADNPSGFTTTASDITNRTLTGSSVSWSSTNLGATGSSYHDSPSLVTPVQAVVNRGGWASGNAMVVIIRGGSTSTRDLTIEAYDLGPGTNPPKLHIEYTANNEVYIATSANITDGEATTARLTPPGSKSTSDFTAGKRADASNSLTVDIAGDFYTELEHHLAFVAANDDYFEFQIYAGSSPLDSQSSIPKATIGDGSTAIDATTDTFTLTERNASVSTGSSISATSVSKTLTERNATVTLGTAIAASFDSFSVTTFDLTLAMSITAGVATKTLTERKASANATELDATADSFSLTEQAATVSSDRAFSATSVSKALTELSATVSTDRAISATSQSLTLTENAAATSFDNALQASVDTLSLNALAALVSAGSGINAGSDTLDIAAYQALVALNASFSATSVSKTLTERTAGITAGSSIGASADSFALTEHQASVISATSISATSESLTLTENAATVVLGSGIAATADAFALTAQNASVSADNALSAGVDSLTLTERAATVTLGSLIVAAKDAFSLTEYAATLVSDTAISATADSFSLTERAASVIQGLPADVKHSIAGVTGRAQRVTGITGRAGKTTGITGEL